MMIMWRRWSAVMVGAVGCAAGAGALGIGCGGGDDSSTNSPDAASADGTTGSPDAGRGDGSATPDATTDAIAPDGSTDGSTTTAIDGSTDAGDGSLADGEAGAIDPALLAFPNQLATAFCGKLAACCLGLDAGAFDTPGCIATETVQGYSASLVGSAGLIDSGLLTLNATKALACLNDIAAIDCGANILTTQGQIALLDDCTAAVVGVLAVGAPCVTSIECATNEFCKTPTDGGTQGLCAPLAGDGGSCAFGNEQFGLSEEACSFRRSGNTDLRCANADLNTGDPFDAATGFVCAPADTLNGGCNFNQDCVTQICDQTSFTCVASDPFVTRKACLTFDVKDAGGG
jgi:hypothetical protein